MSKSNGISYIKPVHRLANQQSDADRALLEKIHDESVRDLSAMLQSLFDGIDDSFFELANNARTNNEQNRYFEAMREIRIKRKSIEADFLHQVDRLFSEEHTLNVHPDTGHQDHSSESGLSLVQQERLEEDVAISSMASKAQANFQGQLLQFQARFSKLYGIDEYDKISSPLAPLRICQAFSLACETLEIDIQARLIVLKQFDRYVMSNFEQVLSHANKTLIRHGVLPKLKTPGIRQRVLPRSEATAAPIIKNEGEFVLDDDEAALVDIYPKLQALLERVRHAEKAQATKHQNTSESISPNQLADLLNKIQTSKAHASMRADEQNTVNIRAALQNEMRKQLMSGQQLSTTDNDLINLVGLLFEFILNDYSLPPHVQTLISKLQIPIVRVVLKDKSFFNSTNHPARKLLNSLAKASISCDEKLNTNEDHYFKQIEYIVLRVLNEFDGDISLFETLNKEFETFLEKENRRAKIVEQRTKESEEGRLRSHHAQKVVEQILSNRILNAHHAIPEIIIETLKNGWSRVMFLAYLKDDHEHQWAHAVKIAEDLIWCSQPLSEPRDRQNWIKIVPKLIKDLKSGLAEVSYSASTLDKTIEEIKSELTTAFKNETVAETPEPKPSNKASNENPASDNTGKDSASKSIRKYLPEVEKLETGTWLEFVNPENKSKVRGKLSSIVLDGSCYIFVNRMGIKIMEKSKIELAEGLASGHICILEQGQMLDRAMHSLLSSLRKKSDK